MIEQVNREFKGARSLGDFGAKVPPSSLGEADARRQFADPVSGETAFRAAIPEEWQATKLELDPTQAYGSWPFTLFFEAQDGNGSIIRYRTAREWVASDPNQVAMACQLGMPIAPNERPIEDAGRYLDSMAALHVSGHEATLRFLGERDWPVEPAKRVSDEAGTSMVRDMRMQVIEYMNQASHANGGMGSTALENVSVHSLCRVYAFDWDGEDYRLALFTTLQSVTTSMRFDVGSWQGGGSGGHQQGGFMQRIGDAAQGATRALGADGFIANAGRKLQDAMFGQHANQGWSQQQGGFGGGAMQQQGWSQQQSGFGGNSMQQQTGFGGFSGQQQAPMQQPNGFTTTEWGDSYLFALITPAARFEEVFAGAFTAFCSSAAIDVNVEMLKNQLAMKRMQEQQAEFERRQWQAAQQQPGANFGQGQSAQQAQQAPQAGQPGFFQSPQQQPSYQQESQQPGQFGQFGQQPFQQEAPQSNQFGQPGQFGQFGQQSYQQESPQPNQYGQPGQFGQPSQFGQPGQFGQFGQQSLQQQSQYSQSGQQQFQQPAQSQPWVGGQSQQPMETESGSWGDLLK